MSKEKAPEKSEALVWYSGRICIIMGTMQLLYSILILLCQSVFLLYFGDRLLLRAVTVSLETPYNSAIPL